MAWSGRNCPNCAAPMPSHSEYCGYCGTRIIDFASIELGKPLFALVRTGSGEVLQMKVMMTDMSVTFSANEPICVEASFIGLSFVKRCV